MGRRGSSRRRKLQAVPPTSSEPLTPANQAATSAGQSTASSSSHDRADPPLPNGGAQAAAPSPAPAEDEQSEIFEGIYEPFLDRRFGIEETSPLCEQVRPPKELGPSPLQFGIKNYTSTQLWDAHHRKIPMRAMIWAARMGLGNALQGFVCALVVSVLSARQLIVSPGGQFGSLVETLPLGFEFNVDFMEAKVPRVPGISKGQTELTDSRPVLQAQPIRFCDDMWHEPERHHCVLQAFNCQDEWCVHSKSISFMLGRPRLALGKAVMRAVQFDPPRLPEAAGRHILLDQTGSHSSPENGTVSSANASTAAEAQTSTAAGEAASQGNRQAKADTAASSSPVSEGSEEYAGNLDYLPSTPEKALQLEFDIAVHIRTVQNCTETWAKDVPGCQENGLPGALQAADQVVALQRVLSVRNWGCLSHLLGFLFKLKAKRQQEQGSAFRGLFRNKEDEEELRDFAHEKHRRQAKRTKEYSNTSSDPLEKHRLWTIEYADTVGEAAKQEAVANLTRGEALGDKGQLNMFLATDSAVLRPLLIKYLRPFGSVAFSKAKPIHLSYYRYDQSLRLGNLGEFYLMSRAAVVFSFEVYWLGKSTFARVAALYGNSSLIYGNEQKICRFPLEHVARSNDKWHL